MPSGLRCIVCDNYGMGPQNNFRYVDLFSGCGGLSLGLERAGGNLELAVERSEMAGETFYHNLISRITSEDQWQGFLASGIVAQAGQHLVISELQNVLNNSVVMQRLKEQELDLVVGGPPCQGFSLAGRRNPSDTRNQLPWQFLEVVEKTQPKMVVIENVVGMRHKFNEDGEDDSVFVQLQKALASTGPIGYVVQATQANALHYGAPQHRPRLLIVGLRKDLAKKADIKSTGELWVSDFASSNQEIPDLSPTPTIESKDARTVRQALVGLGNKDEPKNALATSYLAEMEDNQKWGLEPLIGAVPNHKPRNHQNHAISRFRFYQLLSSNGVEEKILNRIHNLSLAASESLLAEVASHLPFPLKSPDGLLTVISKREFIQKALELSTGKHSQRVLKLDHPARTVLTIGDDYVHPFEPRTFTVRELARFQGFPNAFEFRSKETTGGINRRNEVPQYSQVGNAVSPWLGLAIGEMVSRTLGVLR